jgi:hypothetical protein
MYATICQWGKKVKIIKKQLKDHVELQDHRMTILRHFWKVEAANEMDAVLTAKEGSKEYIQ